MGSIDASAPRHVARSIEEALGAVATPLLRDQVLSSALAEAALPAVPESGPSVLTFAYGPLRDALTRLLGADVGAEVIAQVSPIIVRAAQGRPAEPRRAKRDTARTTQRPTRRAPPSDELLRETALTEPDERPLVIVASTDVTLRGRLVRALDGRAGVRAVSERDALLNALAICGVGASLVLLDCAAAVMSVQQLVEDAAIPAGGDLLVWGTSRSELASLRKAYPGARWRGIPASTSIDRVAQRCVELIDSSPLRAP